MSAPRSGFARGQSKDAEGVPQCLSIHQEVLPVTTRHCPRRPLRFTASVLLPVVLLSACASDRMLPEQAHLEAVVGVIGEVYEGERGAWIISMPPSQRAYSIHPDYSPDSRSLLARARALRAAGTRVEATIWIRDPELGKADLQGGGVPGPPWVLIGLRALAQR